MKLYNRIKEIWDWIQKIKEYKKLENTTHMRDEVLRECFRVLDRTEDFFRQDLSFSSSATKNIALKELNFRKSKFSLVEIMRHIHENISLLNEHNIVNVLIMLTDISLYGLYNIIHNESSGDFFVQLNECIILDAMRIKPDHIIDVPAELKEISEKAEMNIDVFEAPVIWAIAMLNYKTHVYRTAISFFKRFLIMSEGDESSEVRKKRIHAQIYIGYCNEKENSLEGFIEAIRIFEELLLQIEKEQEFEELVTELHHGLGHFYNEKAIFGRSDTESEDLTKARNHMRMALEKKFDYYSCYGSLFHEYGDYESAERIFKDAMNEKSILNNEELVKEMNFYIGQTGSALTNSKNDQFRVAEDNFNAFEEYCERTFNYDGIVHARIFKIRANLRQVQFAKNNKSSERKKCKEQLSKWYKELTEYTLSSYASAAIKEEYWKTIYILRTFQSFYADDSFVWHIEDIQYNLHQFIAHMPSYACELDLFADMLKKEDATILSNLYCIQLGRLLIWCVSSCELKNMIEEQDICFAEKLCDIENVRAYPINDRERAHRCIQKNGKPDLVVLIPPSKKDCDFEQEVSSIMSIVNESYFVFTQETSDFYTNEWLKNITSGKKQNIHCVETVNELLKFAYCFRALEILRKELLQPIPLFSLAPTHFSSSYDFQLGEDIPIQLNYLERRIDGETQRKIRAKLRYVDTKYSSNLLGRHNVTAAINAMSSLCCKDEGFFAACFPHPQEDIVKEDNYISYFVLDQNYFLAKMFPHKIKNGEIYTIKALHSYKDLFWQLYDLINVCESECDNETKDECIAHYETMLTDDNDISIICRKLLNMIFSEPTTMLEYPYKCILRKIEGNGTERDYIYMILLPNGYQERDECKNKSEEKKEDMGMKQSVFVTYAWEPQNAEFQKYQKEVMDFTNKLRDSGYDATFDLASEKNNWTQIMIDGLQKDKIIVLLSPEYKKKADKTIGTGVAIERNAIVERLKKVDGSVIFAKLPSLKDETIETVLPVIFAGENVIDLAKSDNCVTDGYNRLYSRLEGEEIVDLHPIGTKKKKIKKL